MPKSTPTIEKEGSRLAWDVGRRYAPSVRREALRRHTAETAGGSAACRKEAGRDEVEENHGSELDRCIREPLEEERSLLCSEHVGAGWRNSFFIPRSSDRRLRNGTCRKRAASEGTAKPQRFIKLIPLLPYRCTTFCGTKATWFVLD